MKLTPIPSKAWVLTGIGELDKPIHLTITSHATGHGRMAVSYRGTTWNFDTPLPEQRHGERPHEWAARIHPIVMKRMMREQQGQLARWKPGDIEAIADAVKRACAQPGIFG